MSMFNNSNAVRQNLSGLERRTKLLSISEISLYIRIQTMDHDKNVLAKKIVNDIAIIFQKDSLLKEFDIIPVATNNSNKSPVVHVSHRLGIESWCVKYVYSYAYNTLMEKYFSKCHQKLGKVIQNNFEEIDRLLLSALLINPDVNFFWNKRREMYLKEMTTFSEEMKISKIILTRKPKSNEAFSYRRWLFEELFTKKYFMRPSQNQLADLVQEEQSLTASCADKNPNNYHAWSHRIWFMNWLIKISVDSSYKIIYYRELSLSENWISTHISDYSGLHYRQLILFAVMAHCLEMIEMQEQFLNSVTKFVSKNTSISDMNTYRTENNFDNNLERNIINSVVSENSDKYRVTLVNLNLIIYELDLNEDLSNLYPYHEALWSHRRYIVKLLMKLITEHSNHPIPLVKVLPSIDSNYLRKNSSLNITNIPNFVQNKDSFDESDDLGKDAKIIKFDNNCAENNILYNAIVSNEKNWIKQKVEKNDQFAFKYQNWVKLTLNLPV